MALIDLPGDGVVVISRAEYQRLLEAQGPGPIPFRVLTDDDLDRAFRMVIELEERCGYGQIPDVLSPLEEGVLDVMVDQIVEYGRRHYPIPAPAVSGTEDDGA